LAIGANYTIEAVIEISEVLKISKGLIAITAIAIGTFLPELVISVRAALKKKYELTLGNVFGSNVFNVLLITGVPALISPLIYHRPSFFNRGYFAFCDFWNISQNPLLGGSDVYSDLYFIYRQNLRIVLSIPKTQSQLQNPAIAGFCNWLLKNYFQKFFWLDNWNILEIFKF